MKKDIILAGVGGQGILSIAACIGLAALREGLQLKQAEVHGMSQRGGAVQSHLRISDSPIASDIISEGKANIILSVEPMEALRYLPMLASDGWVVTSINPFVNIPNYPLLDEILREIWKCHHYVTVDADDMAKNAGSIKAANMVMLGAASPLLGLTATSLEAGVSELFAAKGQAIVDLNIKAFRAGREWSISQIKP
ncbi:MAG: indolepyruvate oxidoreductase subunit beta [Bacteroidia bacterium]|jgi:indolepyruvate ferredoxin oxidoreductase beta subunit|nr:indolepyruvate oxidoreductase subunit beta [Bacteroidia bacterium]